MFLFVSLIILLALAITFFIAYPIVKRKILPEKFNDFCEKKVGRFAKKNDYLFIGKFKVENYQQKSHKISHILFGKKYIYLISDSCLIGTISGDEQNQSWLYKKYGEENSSYIDNINTYLDENMREFAGIFNINPEILVSICVVPDECDMLVKNQNGKNLFITHYVSINKLIKKIESKNIGSINKEELVQHFELIKSKNE